MKFIKIVLLLMQAPLIMACGGESTQTEEKSEDAIYVGDYYLQDRSDIEMLANYTSIHGDLVITGTALDNLDGVQNIASITGGLYIGCDKFPSFGLSDELVESEAEGCEGNPNLVDIDGFKGLTHIGSNTFSLSSAFVIIVNNPLLKDLDGLSNLETDGLFLTIEGNDTLGDVDGFGNISHLGGLKVLNNDSLTDLDGFSKVEHIDGDIGIWNNGSLSNLNGLLNLKVYSGSILIVRSNVTLPACEADRLRDVISETGWDGIVDITENDEAGVCN